ncbi:MAG: hypothetical protein ACREDT_05585 [Methylocella sp.]
MLFEAHHIERDLALFAGLLALLARGAVEGRALDVGGIQVAREQRGHSTVVRQIVEVDIGSELAGNQMNILEAE